MSAPFDIAFLIPKADELAAFEWAMNVKLSRSAGTLPRGNPYYELRIPTAESSGGHDLSAAVVFLDDQTNSVSASVTEQVLAKLDPTLLVLVGTAAGRPDKTDICSVIVASLVIDAAEWRLDSRQHPRVRHHELPDAIRIDTDRFLEGRFDKASWLERLGAIPSSLCGHASPKSLIGAGASVSTGVIASSNYLHVRPGSVRTSSLRKLWSVDDRIKCIDMESGGFGLVCKRSPRRQWLVIRGISDFGTPESKSESRRFAASASACEFARQLLYWGLAEAHPMRIRVPESDAGSLPEQNLYTQLDFVASAPKALAERLGVDLPALELGRFLTLADFESLCVGRGAEPRLARHAMFDLREHYFTEKYLNYTYANDLRGVVPYWPREVFDALANLGVNLNGKTVVCVGVGNGIELPPLFEQVGRLVGVDVSRQMLDRARQVMPKMLAMHCAAEELRGIRTSSADAYMSLRTYQSSLFDIKLALREAQRVLKSGGALVISVANGYVTEEGGLKKVVRGLLSPGTRTVSKEIPLKVAFKIIQNLQDLGFQSVRFQSIHTDIYIWAIKP